MKRIRKLKAHKIINFRADCEKIAQIEFLKSSFKVSNRSSALKKIVDICTVIIDLIKSGNEIVVIYPTGKSAKLDLRELIE